MQNKLIPVFIVAAIVQMAVLAGAIFAAQKLVDFNREYTNSQEIRYRAASMERAVLSANMSNSNFLSQSEVDKSQPSDQAYRKGVDELEKLEVLCGQDPYYKDILGKLRKTLDISRKLGGEMHEQMLVAKDQGITEVMKLLPALQTLYKVVDKMNIRINELIQHEDTRQQQLIKDRDQSQQMLTTLLFSGLLISLGGAAMIPVLMKRS